DAGDRLVISWLRAGYLLGNQALNPLAALRTVKQDGSPTLPIDHFRTPDRTLMPRAVSGRVLLNRRFRLVGSLAALLLAGAVISPSQHASETQEGDANCK